MAPEDNTQFVFWAPMFRQMIPQLEAKGVRVYNHNPFSYIDAFEKVGIAQNAGA